MNPIANPDRTVDVEAFERIARQLEAALAKRRAEMSVSK